MNILHINTDDGPGGAGRAALRLHISLRQLGEKSRMIVRTKNGQDQDVLPFPRARSLNRGLEYILKRYYRYGSLHYLYYPSMALLFRHPWFLEADAINMHNIHGNYFAYPVLPNLTREKTVIWTLHDMWSFTGHCSNSYTCQRWQSGCGHCPNLDIYPKIRYDTTRLQWQMKSYVYKHSQIHLVVPSRWLSSLVLKSPLFTKFPVQCIPNSVDTDVFKPIDKKAARQSLGLPEDRHILLFVAAKLNDKNKGGDLLVDALQMLASEKEPLNIAVATIGMGGEMWTEKIPFPTYSFGTVNSESTIASIYSASDLMVLPTRMDNLPNSLVESIACGTPCISFDVGGVSEIVRPFETGYLAQAESSSDLAQGIHKFLTNDDLRFKCQLKCRAVAVQEYSSSIQAKRYLDLYHSVVKTN